MATLSITKSYADGDILLEADLDAIRTSIETFANTTKLNSDNLQTSITYALNPPGVVLPYAGSSAPNGYLLCYGQAVSRTTYADLFAITSTTYGTGDGSTTFNLPDLRGRSPFGDDNMGGSTAGRITNAESGIVGTTLGATGGAESITLTTTTMPAHTHGGSGASHYHEFGHTHASLRNNTGNNELGGHRTLSRSNANYSADLSGADTFMIGTDIQDTGSGLVVWSYSDDRGNVYTSGVLDTESGTDGADARTTGPSDSVTGSTGSGGSHNNMPPAIILSYIIKY